MPEPVVSLNEESLKSDLRELVRKTVEDTLNGLPGEEAGDLVGAERHGRTAEREAYPYVCVDGTCLKRSWGGSCENVAVMVATGVSDDGRREAMGAAEGFTESSACWRDFLSWLGSRGLRGVRMFTGDRAAGMVGSIAKVPRRGVPEVHGPLLQERAGQVPKSRRPASPRC